MQLDRQPGTHPPDRMKQGRAWCLLGTTLALAGCVASGPEGYVPPGRGATSLTATAPVATVAGGGGGSSTRVALLVPLTGSNAERGQDLLKAAQLALAAPGAPTLDVEDTGSTPIGAANAARAAIAAGDTLILGPLTSAETSAVAPVTRPSNIPVLAFTSDRSQAQPGVWVLGLTPAQQVRRLVQAAQEGGKPRIAALLPENDLGRAMGDALSAAAASAGLPPPAQRSYGASMGSMDSALRDLSDYADRRGKFDAQLKSAKLSGDKAAMKAAQDAAQQPLPPLPFDALLLADTGTALNELGTLLPYYDAGSAKVMGPALWGNAAGRAGTGGVLTGAWYAAPDPTQRAAFVQSFAIRYAIQPSVLADLAYDAASIARVTAQDGSGSLADSLTRPGGFTGADGALLLLPDGHVLRALAVFELSHGQSSVVAPAPATVGGPSS